MLFEKEINDYKEEIKKEILGKESLIMMLKKQQLQNFEQNIINYTNEIIKSLEKDIDYLTKYCLKDNSMKEEFMSVFLNSKKSEILFKELCNKKNIKCIETDNATDIRFKTDFFIYKNNKKISVDVKSIKRTNKNNLKDCKIQWLEFQNKRGYAGTLYSKVDIIAFEQENSFILVNRESLLEFAESKKANSKIVTDINDALYNLYTRKNYKDLVMKVYIDDIIKNTKNSIWYF